MTEETTITETTVTEAIAEPAPPLAKPVCPCSEHLKRIEGKIDDLLLALKVETE